MRKLRFGVRHRVMAALSCGAVLFGAGVANAATVTSAGNDGLVNLGSGFRLLTSNEPVKKGDVVLAKTSTVTVAYENGCVVEVKPGAVYTIETPEACGVSVPSLTVGNVLIGGAVAGGIAAGVIIATSSGSSP